jgi:hypothetical protein
MSSLGPDPHHAINLKATMMATPITIANGMTIGGTNQVFIT